MSSTEKTRSASKSPRKETKLTRSCRVMAYPVSSSELDHLYPTASRAQEGRALVQQRNDHWLMEKENHQVAWGHSALLEDYRHWGLEQSL